MLSIPHVKCDLGSGRENAFQPKLLLSFGDYAHLFKISSCISSCICSKTCFRKNSYYIITDQVIYIKVNKSVYIAKSRQRYHLTLTDILLHVSNHALRDMYILNYGTF